MVNTTKNRILVLTGFRDSLKNDITYLWHLSIVLVPFILCSEYLTHSLKLQCNTI